MLYFRPKTGSETYPEPAKKATFQQDEPMTRGLHSRKPQNRLLLAGIIKGEQSPHLDIQPGALARLAAAVLSIGAFLPATSQAKLDFHLISLDPIDPVKGPLSLSLQSSLSLTCCQDTETIPPATVGQRRRGKSMSRRSGQAGTIVKEVGWYRVRFRIVAASRSWREFFLWKTRGMKKEERRKKCLDANRPSHGRT
jgi:hypothetical protein